MKTPDRRLALPWALLLGLALGACGGSDKKEVAEPEPDDDEIAEPESEEDELFPPEKLDEVQRFFDRKAKFVSRCFTQAIEAGEIKRRSSGRATVFMVIDTAGRPTKVRVSEMTPESPTLEKCIIADVESWTVTTLPEPLDYSHTFGFGTL